MSISRRSSAARRRSSSSRTSLVSIAVTSSPARASGSAWRPGPQPRSSTAPSFNPMRVSRVGTCSAASLNCSSPNISDPNLRQKSSSVYQSVMIIALGGLLLAAGGCATLGWYGQAARGQMELLLKRKDIEKLLASPETSAEKRRKLELVLQLRDFSGEALALPDNGSYAGFVKLERDAVVYNVIAAPEFSVAPKTWCYPLVGCLAYRGYFKRDAAERRARSLRKQGFDTLVSPVAAYSTLGRFNDPVTSPMLEFRNLRLAGLLFHELAHQRVFVKGETDFNEAYATAVDRAGVRRWLTRNGDGRSLQAWQTSQRLEARL